jgi:hypothetical protein
MRKRGTDSRKKRGEDSNGAEGQKVGERAGQTMGGEGQALGRKTDRQQEEGRGKDWRRRANF